MNHALRSFRMLQQQQTSAQQQQIALQQQQVSFQQQQTTFQQEQTNHRQEQIAWQQQQTAYMTQLLSRTCLQDGSVTKSYHDRRNESTLDRRPTLAVSSSSSNNTKGKTVAKITAKRTWIGIGWYHYQSRIQANHSRTYPLSENLTPKDIDDDKYIERSYFPAAWFKSRGFSYGAARSGGELKYSLRPIRVVSETSIIFQHAWNGNTVQIIKSLNNHEATLYDVDEYGRGLLHVGFPFLSNFSQVSLSDSRLHASRDLHTYGPNVD